MKRFSMAFAACGLLAAGCLANPAPAHAQTSAAPDPGTQVLPKPPPPLPSALGTSVVPVVRPPATPRRHRLHKHTHAGAVATAKPPNPQTSPAHNVAGAGAAASGVAAAVPPVAAPSVAEAPVAEPAAAEPPKIDPNKGTVTGLPLPRWVAFRSDEVNLRSGPGTQYPIDWQYHRRNLPVQITREFEVWRLVTDPDGTKGWVHQATLTGRRGFMVRDVERTLRQSADETAKPVALLKPGVVGYIRSCAAQAAWCEVQAGDYRGWLKRIDFYGVEPDEAVN